MTTVVEETYCACCGTPRSVYLTEGHNPECVWSEPPYPPVVGLDLDEDDEHRRQISLLMRQILSPIYNIHRLLNNVGGLV